MNVKPNNVYDQLPDFLKKAIDGEIEKATEEEIEKAKKRIDERKSEIITRVLLHVKKQVDFQRMGDTLQISVRIEK